MNEIRKRKRVKRRMKRMTGGRRLGYKKGSDEREIIEIKEVRMEEEGKKNE